MYFSNLDGSWNDDEDEFWGEPDEIDAYSEIAVGRMCVDADNEVANMVTKHIFYQNNPVEDDILKGVMAGEALDDWTFGGNCKDQIATSGYYDGYETTGFPADFNINTFYERDEGFTKYDLFDEFSQTGINLINHLGHSNTGYRRCIMQILQKRILLIQVLTGD